MLPSKIMFLQVDRNRYEVADFAAASRMFCAARDRNGEGASNTPTPLIVDENGVVIAYVSYNGRVWSGTPMGWNADSKPIYDNR